MAECPARSEHQHRLFDGRVVTIRPVRPDDAPRMDAFLRGLSDETRYRRFQKWIGRPSEALARYLAGADPARNVVFVCLDGAGADARIVGDARCSVNADGESGEFGVMIADEWHHTGIAGLLMDDLLRAARQRGVKRVEGQVLATNSAMLRFARGLGFRVSAVPGDRTTLRIEKDLAP